MKITITGCNSGAVMVMSWIESDAERYVITGGHRDGDASVRAIKVPGNAPRFNMVAITSGITRWVNYQGVFVRRA